MFQCVKFLLFLALLVWIVDRFTHCVLAENRDATGYIARTLRSGHLPSTVVSGFWINVAWLWEPELPPTLRCVQAILDQAGR